MQSDFNPPRTSSVQRTRSRRRFVLPLLMLAGLGCLFLLSQRQPAAHTGQADRETAPAAAPKIPDIRRELVRGAIQPGDTITSLLGQVFTPQQIHNLNQQCKEVFPLSKLCAGQDYRLALRDGTFERFEYDIDHDEQLIILQGEGGFDVSRSPIPYTVEPQVINGTITSSLFGAVIDSGESEALALNLADIFAWDIDFIRDIQSGDSFQVLVEKRFREGQQAGYGRILAASFTNCGETYRGFLFKDGERGPAYYDENGKSLRKAFLKAPLSFSRISSGFTMRRLHPVTKTYKPHPAIDYAAPTGTPIKTVGDGVVVKATYNRFNGNYVKIRHPGSWETMYNHMSRFGRGIKSGKKVRQGQVIGYVGSTGRSTGPHLDFRMYKNGRTVNPLRVKSPSVAPVSSEQMAAYRTTIAPLVARLDESAPAATQLAAAAPQVQTETASN